MPRSLLLLPLWAVLVLGCGPSSPSPSTDPAVQEQPDPEFQRAKPQGDEQLPKETENP